MNRSFTIHPFSFLIGAAAAGMVIVLLGMGEAKSPKDALLDEIPRIKNRLMKLEKWRAQTENRLTRFEALSKLFDDESAKPVKGPKDRATSLVAVKLSNKRFQNTDIMNHVFEEAVWWDAEYTPVGLTKPTRAVKCQLEFADLFGEVKFRLNSTFNESMKPGEVLNEEGIGFKYNQFLDNHQWMRNTDFKDMIITVRIKSIIYQDGTREEF